MATYETVREGGVGVRAIVCKKLFMGRGRFKVKLT